MNSNNENFIIGLISSIALVVGIIYNISAIRRNKVETDEALNASEEKSVSNKKSKSTPRHNLRKFPIYFYIDILFFLIFVIGSVNAIVGYLANTVPGFAMVSSQFFVAMYAGILVQRRNEYGCINSVVILLGSGIALTIMAMLGYSRITTIYSPLDPIIVTLFSLAVNLALVPLMTFSLISLNLIMARLVVYEKDA
ncbi:MAG: hypothetical protein HYZ22_02225 [Chloroflexi bacterium]|nr:hypothetical protein [Chloroflexota bacterium]